MDLVYQLNYADCSRMSLRPKTVVKPKLDKSEIQSTEYVWGTANKALKHARPMQGDAELLVARLIHAKMLPEWKWGETPSVSNFSPWSHFWTFDPPILLLVHVHPIYAIHVQKRVVSLTSMRGVA